MSMILRTNNPSVAEGHSNFRKSSDDSLLFVRACACVCFVPDRVDVCVCACAFELKRSLYTYITLNSFESTVSRLSSARDLCVIFFLEKKSRSKIAKNLRSFGAKKGAIFRQNRQLKTLFSSVLKGNTRAKKYIKVGSFCVSFFLFISSTTSNVFDDGKM